MTLLPSGSEPPVKRRAANWGRRYAAMPPAERLAVLAAIMAAQAPP